MHKFESKYRKNIFYDKVKIKNTIKKHCMFEIENIIS